MPANDTTLELRTHGWLLLSALLVVLPHVPRLPLWVSLFAASLGGLHVLRMQRTGHGLPRWTVIGLTLAGTCGVFLHHQTLLGRDAGVALLVVMVTLKLLESRRPRDAYVLLFLCYFLVITNFLYSQTPLLALYMFAAAIVITATLSVVTLAGRRLPVRGQLRDAAILLVQALPIMLVLFVFFPRIIGPFWGLPGDAHAGITGLGDSMTPGNISKLAKSDALAFRVQFADAKNTPPPAGRYWRGPVLWQTDGRTWSAGDPLLLADHSDRLQMRGRAVHYSITLEPHNRRWLFGLDLPVYISEPATATADFQWLARQRITSRIRYQATSYPDFDTGELPEDLRRAALQLPDNITGRMRELVGSWRHSARDDSDIVRTALRHFSTQPYVYTLEPPLLGDSPVDEFLFTTRRGFCEHYAAAFVTLMRIAGIPARVVTGYQGGEYNPVGDYWLVRQSDAHAWAEAWLPGAGWQRVDPTAAVAPERIEYALDNSLQSAGEPAGFLLGEGNLLARHWRTLRHLFDTLDNTWNQWVLAYNPKRQMAMLRALGFTDPDWQELALLMLALIGSLLAGIAAWMLLRRPRQPDPVARAWSRYCTRLARLGLPRRPDEGPQDYARRIARERPDLEQPVWRITDVYTRLHYGAPVNRAAGTELLQKLVRRFPPRPAA
jgi:transglutaminase-like putative cysteine protease